MSNQTSPFHAQNEAFVFDIPRSSETRLPFEPAARSQCIRVHGQLAAADVEWKFMQTKPSRIPPRSDPQR
jgi:hypothetical protein